jgi:hypothetical protein
MVVVRFRRPTLVVEKDKGMKPAAYGHADKPFSEPSYPITVANVQGKGRYRLLIAGDGDHTAVFKVYVDGETAPKDYAESDAPAIIEGIFESSVVIRIEGSGLHSTYSFEVWTEQDYVTSVAERTERIALLL